jgi:glycosyltransferase involved in cell wall biosynthesis
MTDSLAEHNSLPLVSIVVPMLNEEHHIRECLSSILSQQYPPELIEAVVVDGGSSDQSCEIVRALQQDDQRITLAGGPNINCPAAMNMGIRLAKGSIICKVDGHGYIAPDYVCESVKLLNSDDRIGCVGGPIRPISKTTVAAVNVLARGARFGVGGGVNVFSHETKEVSSVQCGAYRKRVFDEVGVFDEALQFGEDEEINWRVLNGGYRIVSTPKIRFFYYPRDTFKGLFRQYFNYGKARFKVIQKHPTFLRIKHTVPSLYIVALCVTAIASAFVPAGPELLGALVASYVLSCVAASATLGVLARFRQPWLLPISFACLHFGYGAGMLFGLWEAATSRWPGKSSDNKDLASPR